ncbi:SWIM zinc finger family protein [Natronococcus jeotgali]|uniref:Zinc finger SWIM domain protein n=1 Tax=Natronococcus jeotgali DSM 18795 TaxID=1227498 RepID=L9X5D9_9EURY|nr:SWIM zinc finger family protein [Natronococcus jeotgali]ELY55808.1 zinc finger SWIM domain protein [Natronococcus jeotgali DSM 18795]
MPTFGRTASGKWHLVGPDGCRYGRAFAGETDTSPDETVTATDIVAYEPPDDDQPNPVSVSLGTRAAQGSDEQRLVFPTAVRESSAELCESCRSRLQRHQKRRARLISGLKQVTPLRDVDWEESEHEIRRACDWCRAHERTTWQSERLGCTVCPACGRLFETPLGEPTAENTPDVDRLPETPAEPITPIVIGTTLPEYDPTELGGSNRPLIKYRAKHKYAEMVFELERTGHGFSAEGIAALERIRASYADQIAADDAHRTDVTLEVAMTPRTVTLDGLLPEDRASVIDECWGVVSDPANWVPIGWPEQGRIHRRAADPSIPGNEPVTDVFPRLQTQSPAQGVDTEALQQASEPGRYERGTRYYERGAVTEIERVENLVQATVRGSRTYDVQVTLSEGRYADGRCSCPDDAVPCKHIVATVLASGDVDPVGEEQSLDALLAAASAEELRTLLRDFAADVTLRKRIYEELGEE